GHRWAVQWGPLIEGDLRNPAALPEALKGIEGVIHFAGDISVGESMSNPRKFFGNNVVGTLNLLNAMVDAGVKRIVFSSTAAVYGDPEFVPIPESHPRNPVSPYGDSKLFVEKMLRWYGEAYGMRSAALRYFNAAGADPGGAVGEDHAPETHLIPLVIAAAHGLRPAVDLYGTDYPTPDGTAIRDYIHVADLADAHVRSLAALESCETNLTLNLGTGTGSTVREVIQAVEKASGRAVPVRECGRRAGDPPSLVADARLAGNVLGWKPKYSALSTIAETAWKWHSRSRSGVSS
ncbi:MAG: UDP-glucose 4-epimerase GalE, partial [Bryobacteraceae bacterium]